MRFGLDVGGTKTEAVAVTDDGRIVGRIRRTTGWGADAVAAAIVDVVSELAEAAGIAASAASSIGIGIPGQVVPGTARVVHAVNLGVAELDLVGAIGPAFGVPVHVENDVKAAALGASALRGGRGVRESLGGRAVADGPLRGPAVTDGADGAPGASGNTHGAGRGSTIAYLNLGTGVAAGIVQGGRLWRGARGAAGEIGHIVIDPDGAPCPCGQRGCIETLAGGAAIAARWGRPAAFPVRDVFDAADAGDTEAIAVRDGLARGVSAAIRILALTVDVDVVVLGGGVTVLGDRLLGPVKAHLRRGAASSAFIRSLRLDERVELLPPGSPAAAFGAALLGDPGTNHPFQRQPARSP